MEKKCLVMPDDHYVLYRMAVQLRKDLVSHNNTIGDSYEADLADSCMFYIDFTDRYEELRKHYENVIIDKSSIHLPILKVYSGFGDVNFAVGQMISGLEGIFKNPLEENKKLKNEIKSLNNKKSDLESQLSSLSKTIEKFVDTEDFKIDEKKIKGIPSEIQDLFYEALNTYRNGCYIACCLMCGRILEALVKDACDKTNIKFSGLGDGIKGLKAAGCLGGKPHDGLMSLSKYYRDKVAHPTSEVFGKDKAKWFLSSLLILIDELFQKA